MHLFFAYRLTTMTAKEKRERFEKLKRSKDLATAKDLAETKRVDEVIRQLKAWRTRNNLSQRQAVFAMESRDCPVDIATLQQWEQGRYRPSNLAAKALETFLATYPTIIARRSTVSVRSFRQRLLRRFAGRERKARQSSRLLSASGSMKAISPGS